MMHDKLHQWYEIIYTSCLVSGRNHVSSLGIFNTLLMDYWLFMSEQYNTRLSADFNVSALFCCSFLLRKRQSLFSTDLSAWKMSF